MSSFKRQSDYEKRYQQPTGLCGNGAAFFSALLAALSFCTSFGSVDVMAEETAPAAETVQPLTEEPAQAESSTVPGTPQTPAGEQTGSAAQTTAQSAAPIPNTSDTFPLVPVLLLLAFSACLPYHSRSALPQTQAVKRKHNAVCPNRAIIAVVL